MKTTYCITTVFLAGFGHSETSVDTVVSLVCALVLNEAVHAADLQCLFVLSCGPGSRTVQAPGEPSLGAASAASIKPQLHRARPPQTPTRPSSLMGPPPTPSRLPRRTPGPSGTLAEAGVHAELSEGAGSTQGNPNKDLHGL